VYRKLMMLLMAVAVLGLAIGLVGCPKKAAETTAPPPGVTPNAPPAEYGPGRTEPPGLEQAEQVRKEMGIEVKKGEKEVEEEATGE